MNARPSPKCPKDVEQPAFELQRGRTDFGGPVALEDVVGHRSDKVVEVVREQGRSHVDQAQVVAKHRPPDLGEEQKVLSLQLGS